MTAAHAALRSLRSLRPAQESRGSRPVAVDAGSMLRPKVRSFQLPGMCSFGCH